MKVGTNVEVIVGTNLEVVGTNVKVVGTNVEVVVVGTSRYKRTSSRYKCLLIGKQEKGKGLRSV